MRAGVAEPPSRPPDLRRGCLRHAPGPRVDVGHRHRRHAGGARDVGHGRPAPPAAGARRAGAAARVGFTGQAQPPGSRASRTSMVVYRYTMRGGSVRPWMAFAGFAVFGALWGVWGASIPAIRDQADVTEGQLGAALLFVGAGALPAMPLSGRAVDRWGLRATAALLALLGGAGLLVAAARDFVTLAIALAL